MACLLHQGARRGIRRPIRHPGCNDPPRRLSEASVVFVCCNTQCPCTSPCNKRADIRPIVDVSAADELVLGAPRHRLLADWDWRGVRDLQPEPVLAAIVRHGTYRPRREAEDDPSWKQVIPYLVLRDGERVFLMQRTRAGGDARLHDRWSVGIGGHLNPGDGGPLDGWRREWVEEIEAGFVPDVRLLGFLNDDSTPVGSVHFGVVLEADATGRPAGIRETEKLTGRFATLDEAAAVRDRMETWSALVLDALLERDAERPRAAVP
jgi:predicted NUDIX family phosphoesterase